MIALVLLSACGDPEGVTEAREAYEAAFPDAYCAWVMTCPDPEHPDGQGIGLTDCNAWYADVMVAEGLYHPCFDERIAERCLESMDPADESYVTCEAPQRVRPRPPFCWSVTWIGTCDE
jgi:hypothetical protein